MYQPDKHMRNDSDQNKNHLQIDEEYEEISSVESPHPYEIRNSVHFILDEQVNSADTRYDDGSPQMHRLSLPSMQLQNHDSSKRVSIQVNDEEFEYDEEVACDEDEPVEETKNVNAYNQENARGHIPTFEEETGGLTPSMTQIENFLKYCLFEPLKHRITRFHMCSIGGVEAKGNKNSQGRKITEDLEHTLFFSDKKRRIDLVLVYDDEDFSKGVLNEHEYLRIEQRQRFQKSLEEEGLELEIEPKENSFDQRTCFVKINCPYSILLKHASAMHIQRPVKLLHISWFFHTCEDMFSRPVYFFACVLGLVVGYCFSERLGKTEEESFETESLCFPLSRVFRLNSPLVDDDTTLFTSTFSQNNDDKLILKERERYYTSAQRTQIVWQILLRARFGEDNNIGIRKLLKNRTYQAAFPLHEGRCQMDPKVDYVYDRQILHYVWARATRWYKYQPLWLVRKYFGDKIALYFAWLGFYTNMLILPSIVGLICFIYGLATMDSPENVPSREICDPNIAGNITLCPLCDTTCKYQKLRDSCLFSNVTYLFDNTSTVFFSVFMSFWATSFLELWKRKQALISWQWDLNEGLEDDDTRPEYDTSVTTYKINPVTRRKEPFVPTWKKTLQLFVSTVVVAFMIFIVFCALVITIVLRLIMFTVVSDSKYYYLKTHAKLFTTVLAAMINLLIIMILNKMYHYIAIWLTNEENPRTHTQYEKSFIVKIFLFEFINYYSSLIYIAFFKGRFFTHPGDSDSRNSILLRLRGDVCDPAGCLSELCIQLAIIMIGKQFFSNILELLFPALRNWWRSRIISKQTKEPTRKLNHWEENYAMQDPGKLALFEEYLEMVIQYGFITLFVAAFPLAPLFALLNNICEIRLDAYKMTAQARRPVAEKAEDIGAWFWILRVITYCAVISNAFVIAYTSDYIPRKVYQLFYSEKHSLEGYIDSSLSGTVPSLRRYLSKKLVSELCF